MQSATTPAKSGTAGVEAGAVLPLEKPKRRAARYAPGSRFGQIYTALLRSERPLKASEIARVIGYAASNTSALLAQMKVHGTVARAGEPYKYVWRAVR